jgi:hypothetical protein
LVLVKTQTLHTYVLARAVRALDVQFLTAAISLSLLCGGHTLAQDLEFDLGGEFEEDELETDRDAFTPALTTVGRRNLVVESAYSLIDNRDTHVTHSFPELLMRYGISDWTELRLGWNYEVGGGNAVSGIEGGEEPGGIESERESRIFYGAKVQISEQERWMPRSVFIAQGFTPTGGEETATQFVGTYGFGWELFDRVRWDSAIRYGTGGPGEDRFDQWAPSTVVRMPFWERWNLHLEYFAITTQGREDELSQGYISPGIHCLLTPNLELGARVGWGVTNDAASFFSNVGMGIRF